MKIVRRTQRLTVWGLALIGTFAWADTRTWTGSGDMEWTQPDTTSWDATYQSGDDVIFGNTGVGTISIVGSVTPGNLLFNHSSGTYVFSYGTGGSLAAGGGLTNLGGGIVQFGNLANAGPFGGPWAGETYVAGGSHLALTRPTTIGGANQLVVLDDGTLSIGADNTTTYWIQNPLQIGAGGGTVRAVFSSNQTFFRLTNVISGAGPLTLISAGGSANYGSAGLAIGGAQTAFVGSVSVVASPPFLPGPHTVRPTVTYFTTNLSLFPNATQIGVGRGGILGVEFAITESEMAKVVPSWGAGLAARGPWGTLANLTEPTRYLREAGILVLDNFSDVADRYGNTSPMALTNNQVNIVGRNAASTPVVEQTGPLSVVGGAVVRLNRRNASNSGVVLNPSEFATPAPGSSLLIEVSASGEFGETASQSTIAIQTGGSRPAVTNGMLPPSIQFYEGGNVLGHFVAYGATDTNRMVQATYTSTDINAAGPSDIVNIGASAQTLTSTKTVHAVRMGQHLTLNSGVTLTLGSGGLIMANVTLGGGGDLDFGSTPGYIGVYNAAAQATISARILAQSGLTILGVSQTLTLNNAGNQISGGITINGGAVRFATTASQGNDITVNAYGTLIVGPAGNGVDKIGGLRGIGRVSGWLAGAGGPSTGTLVITASAGTNYVFDGLLQNGSSGRYMGLIKDGPGIQTFGSNSLALYTGYTVVTNNGGTLQIDGSLAGSPEVRVYSGGTLQGTGFIGGNIVMYGGTLAPGASPGTLTVTGSVTFSSSSTFEVELLGPLAGQYDKLFMVGSSLNLGGATLSVSAPNLLPFNTVFPIIQGWSSINSTFGGLSDGATFTVGPNEFQINYGTLTGYDDAVTLTVIPEPGTYGMLMAALLAMWLRRRTR